MLKRRIFAASLASVLALSSSSVAAFAADEKTTAYASLNDLKKLVKSCQDKDLDQYGDISVAKFNEALDYAENVLADAEATADDYAVSYTILKTADDKLIVKSIDELKALLERYKHDYDGENILNEDIGNGEEDYKYKEDTYEDFAYAYSEAEALVESESDDSNAITNAWEELNKAGSGLTEKDSVTKADFASEFAKLQQAQKKEFNYHAWQRGEVSGTGTKYDNQTYAWGMLFYHVWSAYDNIEAQFNVIKNNKSLNVTSNEEVYKAYKACQEAVKVLNAFEADTLKSYRNEDAVRDIINKTYKSKLMSNKTFVEGILKATISEADLVAWTYDNDKKEAKNEADKINAKTTWDQIKDHVKKDQITVYALTDLYVTRGGRLVDESSDEDNGTGTKVDGKEIKQYKAGDPIDLVGDKNLADFIQVLGQLTYGGAESANCPKYENNVWDGNTWSTHPDDNGAEMKLGQDSKLIKETKLDSIIMEDRSTVDHTGAVTSRGSALTGWFAVTKLSGGADGGKKLGYGPFAMNSDGKTEVGTYGEVISNSDKLWNTFLTPSIQTALGVLNGKQWFTTSKNANPVTGAAEGSIGGYSGASRIADDSLLKTGHNRGETESEIISSKAVDLDNLDDKKVSATEWTAIGNYLNLALGDWLNDPTSKYSVKQAYNLIDKTDDIVKTTAESAVFKELNEDLVEKRAALLKDANANDRTTKKQVNEKLYEDVVDANEALEEAMESFAYTYQDIYDYIATVNKFIDANPGSDSLKAQVENVAYLLLSVEDLATNGDDVPDKAFEDGEFKGYNRLFTNDKDYEIALENDGKDIKITKSKGGANQSHYDLKTAYKALQDAYESLTEPTTTKGDGQKSRCATFP